jgi:hypothetical protein
MSQGKTGKLTEARVKRRLEALGLIACKPVPDRGVDIEAWLPTKPDWVVRIQVKGRNPKKVSSLRWFQLRAPKSQLEAARARGASAASVWQKKLAQADFLVLDAVKAGESWVFSHKRALKLIRLNERVYGNRPNNVFTFDEPLKDKQKEMNLDIQIAGKPLTEHFKDCLENFDSITKFLKDGRGQQRPACDVASRRA